MEFIIVIGALIAAVATVDLPNKRKAKKAKANAHAAR